MTTSNSNGNRVALVVGSGSVKCAAALGLWRVLKREGIELDMVVGCSGGSLYTAAMALGFEQEETEQLTMKLWTRKVTDERDWRGLLSVFMPKTFKFDSDFGLVKDRAMLANLTSFFGDRTFADTTTPLYIVATDLHNGEKVVLSSGRIVDAIRASIAVPWVWPAWQVDGRWLVDGCMSDPLPVDVAMKEGANIILAMGFESPGPGRTRSAIRYAFQLNSIQTNNLLRASFAFHNLAHHTEIIPILPDFKRAIGLYSTRHIPYVIEEGERAAEAQLPYIRQLLAAAA
jgi:NTE family protein